MSERATVVLADQGTMDDKGIFRKRILYQGKFLHPDQPNRFFEVGPEHFQDMIKNFKDKVLDKVQLYHTHREDPRNIGGEVVGVEAAEDPVDKKQSLYALVKPHDDKTKEMLEKNTVGVSAGIDNVYREHLEGKPVGTLLRHLAIVGEPWIKQLGGFMPIHLSDSVVYLSESGGKEGAVYIEADGEAHLADVCGTEALLKELTTAQRKALKASDWGYIEEGTQPGDLSGHHFPIHDAAHVRTALARLSESPFGDKAKKNVETAAKRFGVKLSERNEGMPTREETIKTLKEEYGIDVEALMKDVETGKTTVSTANTTLGDIRKALQLGESEDIVKSLKERDEKAKAEALKAKAILAVDALVKDSKIKPAQKDDYVKMFVLSEEVFTAVTKDLKKGASGIKLGEKGTQEGEETDTEKEAANMKEAEMALVDAGVPLKGHQKNGTGKES